MRNVTTLSIAVLLVLSVCLIVAQTAHAVPLPVHSFVASDDIDGNAVWEDTGTIGSQDWTMGGGALLPVSGIDDGVTTISAAYQYPAANSATASNYGTLTSSLASFEMWFRAGDVIGEHLIFEAGGSTGTDFLLDGSDLRFVSRSGTEINTSVTLTAQATSQFQHIVGVVRSMAAGAASIELWHNGVQVSSDSVASGYGTIWAGTDVSGLGEPGGGVAYPGDAAFILPGDRTDFDGQIGIFNIYDSALLEADIVELYEAQLFVPPVPEPSSFLLLGLGVLGLVRHARRRRRRA